MKKNRNKYLIYITIGLVALIFILRVSGIIGKEHGYEVTTEKPLRRTITETVSASGKIQPEVEVKISPDVSGEIVELYVKEGQEVKKGEILCKINPLLYENNLNRAAASVNTSKANLANAKARLVQAKANFTNVELIFERNKKLKQQGAISDADFDNVKAQYESGKAEVEAALQNVNGAEFNVKNADATLDEAGNNLARTIIRSPVDGKISKLNVELGERVVGTSQMAGTELMRIANLNEMEVVVDVNENDIVKVKLFDTAVIEVDAYLDRKFSGIVTSIANSATTLGTNADQITNFQVKIRILKESYSNLIKDENTSPFRPGMTATVDIKTKTVSNVLSIPIQAVTTRTDTTEEEGKGKNMKTEEEGETNKEEKQDEPIEVIFTFNNGKAKLIPVKTGIQNTDFIEIVSPKSLNEEVITGPYKTISKLLKKNSVLKKEDTAKDKK